MEDARQYLDTLHQPRSGPVEVGRAIDDVNAVVSHGWKLFPVRRKSAVPQLDGLRFARDANLVALVKPTAELGLGRLPEDSTAVADATAA